MKVLAAHRRRPAKEVPTPRRNRRHHCSIALAGNLAPARTPQTRRKTSRSQATTAPWSMLTGKPRGCARTWWYQLDAGSNLFGFTIQLGPRQLLCAECYIHRGFTRVNQSNSSILTRDGIAVRALLHCVSRLSEIPPLDVLDPSSACRRHVFRMNR